MKIRQNPYDLTALRHLTEIAELPPGAIVDVRDRYAEKLVLWPKLLLIVFFLWWIYAFLDDTGTLYRLTRTWQVPLGKPPAASKSEDTK